MIKRIEQTFVYNRPLLYFCLGARRSSPIVTPKIKPWQSTSFFLRKCIQRKFFENIDTKTCYSRTKLVDK